MKAQISKAELVLNYKTKIADLAEHGSVEVDESGFSERSWASYMLAILTDEDWEEQAYIDSMTQEELQSYEMWKEAEYRIDFGEFSGDRR